MDETDQTLTTEFDSSEEFAKILSKAMRDNENLRIFIHDEALRQYDKDYDVFYPWTKEKNVSDGLTFHDVLSGYDEKGILPLIERELPLLTIHVPDWSWAEEFSVKTWDTSDPDISVIYTDSEDRKVICDDGGIVYTLEAGQIPGFASVIVKRNERMKVASATRSGNKLNYEFIDDEFNASLAPQTRVEHEYYDRTFDTEDYSNFVSAEEMRSKSAVAITAYNTFKDNPYASHRDNIYYGMTNDIENGKLNVHISEYIAKIRLGTFDSEFLFDGNDFESRYEEYTRYVSITDSVLLHKFAYDGNLELYFHIFVGNNEGTATEVAAYKSVSFDDVFQLSKVHVDYKHKTWISGKKWVFTVDKKCYLPKWYDANIRLPKWDISSQSTIINIKVSEYDNEEETTTSVNVVNSKTENFTSEGSGSLSGNIKKIGNANASGSIKVGYGTSSKDETTETVTTKIKKYSNDLGTALLYYTEPIIESQTILNGVSGYRVRGLDTGYVYMLILPRYE